jgi:hypothetical protein
LHLFRLSYGEGRNFCRIGKRELSLRARVSERRLNVALDGLVSKGHVKPLHRSTEGTLYRVYLPSEILGGPLEPGLVAGERRAAESAAEAAGAAPDLKRRARPLESPLNEERFADVAGRPRRGPAIAEMADWFFRAKGVKPRGPERELAITALTGLLEDGFSRPEVMTALEWFVRNLTEEKTLEKLPYFIAKALEESGA